MQAIIALGSNLGDRAGHLVAALRALDAPPAGRVLAVSPVYETAPVSDIAQPDFLNAVCALETTLPPEELLTVLLEIEARRGRVRSQPNGPRTLDLDLLFYENEERATPLLTLPHPRFAERAFVCAPLLDLLAMPPLAESEIWNNILLSIKINKFDTGVARWPSPLNWKIR